MFRRLGTISSPPRARSALAPAPASVLALRLPFPLLVAGAALLALALAVVTSATPARANGTPIKIVLSHLNGVSNWGPRNATGVAEMITSEGEVRLTAAGMEKLPDNVEYQLWITAGTTDRMRLGLVEVSSAGVGRLDTVIPGGIPEKSWDLMVVTVEAKGAQPATPGENRSIAGRFSMTQGGGAGPRVLPNTGGGELPSAGAPAAGLLGLSNGGTVLLLLLVVGGIGFALGRVGSRRGA
jgi:hypothetical protein